MLEPISRFCAYFPDVNECMFSFRFRLGKHARQIVKSSRNLGDLLTYPSGSTRYQEAWP